MEYPPCLEIKYTTLPMLSSLLSYSVLYMRSCISFPHSKKCAKHCIEYELETFAIADSPGCPSPTDSEVNMKEPSSSRSLIIYWFFFPSARLDIFGKLKKQMLLGSHRQQPGEVWSLCPTGPLRQKWTDTGQRPCSRDSLVYKTSVLRPHGPVYIRPREHTYTCSHTSCESMGQSISGGSWWWEGVGTGAGGICLLTLCVQCDAYLSLCHVCLLWRNIVWSNINYLNEDLPDYLGQTWWVMMVEIRIVIFYSKSKCIQYPLQKTNIRLPVLPHSCNCYNVRKWFTSIFEALLALIR